VDEAPVVVAQIDPLADAGASPAAVVASEAAAETAEGKAAPDLMDRLYRPQALDVPVLVPRDGPIAAIDPRMPAAAGTAPQAGVVADSATGEALPGDTVQVLADARPGVEVLAVRPSWVRVSSTDGTVLFEKILDAGERYAVPQLETAAVFRTGNSGSVYFVVNGVTYGPAAPGANVVKDVALSAEALTGKFAQADLTADEDLARVMTADASASAPATPGEGAVEAPLE
jgi:hypothetical protein